MAREVNLVPRKKASDLLGKVTGTSGPIPPPAKPHAGMTGTPPLPMGKVVGMKAPSSLTPAERSAMDAIGWTEDMPIPENMASIFEQIKAEKQAQGAALPPPIDPRTPKLDVKTQELDSLSPEEQQRWLKTMQESAIKQTARIEAEKQQKQQSLAAQIPGLQDAMRVASTPSTEPLIEDDRDVSKATEASAPPASETGAALHQTHCQHCDGDLGVPGIPEPDYGDKMAFLHSVLGQRCWMHKYDLFDGQVEVVFRTLTPKEIDTVFKQAYYELNKGQSEPADFWERVNRYRLFLQLQTVKAVGENGFIHDLPDGLSKASNPDASVFWWKEEDDTYLEPTETPIPEIEKHLIDNVIKTEAMFRILNRTCNRFNRLVAKMEAMVDNSDFWKPTEAQS